MASPQPVRKISDPLTRLSERLAGDARVAAEVSGSIEQVRNGNVLTTAEVLKSHLLALTANRLAEEPHVAVQVKRSLEQVRHGDLFPTSKVLAEPVATPHKLHKSVDIEARPLPVHDAYEHEG